MQIRLFLFKQNIKPVIFERIKTDLEVIFKMVHQLVKEEEFGKSVPQFVFHLVNFDKQLISYTRDAEGNRMGAMLLYSTLDFMRHCMFESNKDPSIDLCEFARITDEIFKLAIYSR